MPYIDTHIHITSERYDDDRAETIARMAEAGVTRAIVISDITSEDTAKALAICSAHEGFHLACGAHPHDADKWNAGAAARLQVIMERAVALGEMGLDYYYEFSPRAAQKVAFLEQLDMAYRLDKPVILHIRDAHGDAIELLTAAYRAGRLPRGVLHCYSGSWESAKVYLRMGFYISMSGSVTFKNAPRLAEVAQNAPLNRLMAETDCPFLAPEPLRGRRNEPAFVTHTYAKIAALRGIPLEEFAEAANANASRLFSIK